MCVSYGEPLPRKQVKYNWDSLNRRNILRNPNIIFDWKLTSTSSTKFCVNEYLVSEMKKCKSADGQTGVA